MAAVYNTGAVDYGCKTVAWQRGAWTSVSSPTPIAAAAILDSLTINRPTERIDRPNQIGEPNGFVLVPKTVTGECVMQHAALVQPEVGDYFVLTLDTSIGEEMFVFESVGTPYEVNGYLKSNITLVKDPLKEGI